MSKSPEHVFIKGAAKGNLARDNKMEEKKLRIFWDVLPCS
jgi:hypothetical protein